MSCPTSKCLCDKLVISQAVSFANNQLIINIPAGSYANGEKYCIVVAQAIPTATTITSNAYITIGDGTTLYPLVNCNCTNVNACQLSTRKRYSVRVHTNIQNGVFKLLGPVSCCQCRNNTATALPVETTTTTP